MEKMPDFVLIVSDDMGYSDMPLYAGSSIRAPALDRQARSIDGEAENAWELYDLSKDLCEQHNQAPEYPELTAQIAAEFADWRT